MLGHVHAGKRYAGAIEPIEVRASGHQEASDGRIPDDAKSSAFIG
jgi:hypothetical protein